MGKFKNKDVYLVMGSNSFSGSNFIDFLLNKDLKLIGINRSKKYKVIFTIKKIKCKKFTLRRLI